MTMKEAVELGKSCLVEFEGRLKVKDVLPYARGVTAIQERIDESLDNLTVENLKEKIYSVLNRLAACGDFNMSEAQYVGSDEGVRIETAKHGKLRVTFTSGHSLSSYHQESQPYVWVSCWCFPLAPRS